MSLSSYLSINSFYIENLGCAKNQVDAEEMIRALEDEGLQYLEEAKNADIIIVNSCGFIGPAKEESLDFLLDYRAVYPDKKIILAGCLAQRYGDEMELPEADGIFGNRNPGRITEILRHIVKENQQPVLIPEEPVHLEGRTRLLNFPGSSYLKIAEGCDNRCSFCAIPLIRGGVQSRSISEIVDEFRTLIGRGVREINLIAQDLASYGIDRNSKGELISLLQQLLKVPGEYWIRLLYIHPDRFPGDLISLVGDNPRILPYFDLPFQHASGRILSSMGRVPDMQKNLDLVAAIRENLPGTDEIPYSVIRSTFLLGYPGEKEKDIEMLKEFQQKAGLDWLGCFVYSREEGTPAYGLQSDEEHDTTVIRAQQAKSEIEDLQVPITESRVASFVGLETDVLIEERVEGEDLFIARAYMQAPEVDGVTVVHGTGYHPGEIVRVKLIKQNGFDLEAIKP